MDKISIGKKIRAARQKLGVSQAEFAERIGTSPKSLSSWERGAYLVDVIMLNTIAKETGLTLNDFTDESPSGGSECAVGSWVYYHAECVDVAGHPFGSRLSDDGRCDDGTRQRGG